MSKISATNLLILLFSFIIIVAIIVAAAWLISKPDFEPLVTLLAAIAALVAKLAEEREKANSKNKLRRSAVWHVYSRITNSYSNLLLN